MSSPDIEPPPATTNDVSSASDVRAAARWLMGASASVVAVLVLQPHFEISVWSRPGRETATAVIVWVCVNQTIGGGRAAYCRRDRPGRVG